MVGKIFKQMWIQRKQNGWIFFEMIIISFFLWKAVDPIYTLTVMNNLDKGYNPERAFSLDVRIGGEGDRMATFNKILDAVKLSPMIEDAAIINRGVHSGTPKKTAIRCKSEKSDGWLIIGWNRAHQSYAQNYMNIVGYRDINTGQPPVINENIPLKDACYITRLAAAKLFPDGSNPVGQKIYISQKSQPVVAGVIDDVITSFGTYNPFAIDFSFSETYNVPEAYDIVVKIKDGVEPDKFKTHFIENDIPRLSFENGLVNGIYSLSEIYSNGRVSMGIDGQIRLQYMLSFFFIACAFLGIAGTIWIKCNSRRSEIGLYRALGSTKRGILKMFYTESATIVTLAYIIALVPLVAIILNNNEFMFSSEDFDTAIDNSSPYMYKRFLPHFGIVTLITYAILMGTAFIGTYITVHKYSNLQPSEALRDE